MKTKLFLTFTLAVAFFSYTAKAQTQPQNGGFELWDSIATGVANPTGWSSFNNFVSLGAPVLSFKTTDSHSGTYALRVISQTAIIPPPLGTNTLDTVTGYVFIGGLDMNHAGTPYTDRPISISAWVKSTVVPGGTIYLVSTLSKWNSITNQRDNVAQAVYPMTNSFATYTQITTAFNYSSANNPDTLNIQIMAGDPSPTGTIMPGNEYFIDDVTFNFPAVANGLLNLDFEYWDPIAIGAENPSGWSSFNNFAFFGVPTLTFKTNDAHSGSFALRMISDTATLPPPFGSNMLDTIPGYVFLGDANMDNPGFPFTQRPTSISAWVKGTVTGANIFYFYVTLSKWNSTTLQRDVVGQIMHPITSTVPSYMQITDPFNYVMPDSPDTISIQLMCGDPSPTGIVFPGSEFFVDDISFAGLTELYEIKNDVNVTLYPNPSNGIFSVKSESLISKIEIINVIGKTIYSSEINSNQTIIDFSKQAKGIYFYQVQTKDNNISTGKLVIK